MDINKLIDDLLINKFLVILFTAFFAVFSVIYSLSLQNYYTSTAILKPQHDQNSSSALSQFSGLSSMVGLDLQAGGQDMTDLALASLYSKDFFERFYAKDEFIIELMAVDHYDRSSKRLAIDENAYDVSNGQWKRINQIDIIAKPTLQESHEEFIMTLSSSKDKATGFVNIAIEHRSPLVSKKWLEFLISELNQYLYFLTVEEARSSLEYLEAQLSKNHSVEITKGLSTLIEEKLRIILLSEVTSDYAFAYIEKPRAPEKKSRPGRALICILITLTAFFLSALIALMLSSKRKLFRTKKNLPFFEIVQIQ